MAVRHAGPPFWLGTFGLGRLFFGALLAQIATVIVIGSHGEDKGDDHDHGKGAQVKHDVGGVGARGIHKGGDTKEAGAAHAEGMDVESTHHQTGCTAEDDVLNKEELAGKLDAVEQRLAHAKEL